MRPGPRRSIKQSDIVAAAFEILEQSGFAAVSIRGVAAALGLTPTAMYTYFPSKQELLSAMVEELFAGVLAASSTGERRRADPRAAAGPGGADVSGDADAMGDADASADGGVDDTGASVRSGDASAMSEANGSTAVEPTIGADASTENLLAAAIELRDRLRAHPGAVSLVTVSGVAGVGTIALIERLGQGFVAVGLPADDAARAAHAFLAHTIGQVALEQAWGEASDDVAPTTLWSDEPTRPVADAGERLGLRAGADEEFRISAGRLIAAWVA